MSKLPVIGWHSEDYNASKNVRDLFTTSTLHLARDARVSTLMTKVLIMISESLPNSIRDGHMLPNLSGCGPIDTRIPHVLSDGHLAYSQALKISLTPFPFPYSQLTVALLVGFGILTPFVVVAYVINIWICCLLIFVIGMMYWALHEVSREIEEPFK